MQIGGRDLERLCALSRDLMFVARDNGALLGVNGVMQQRLGFADHELCGKSLYDFLHPNDIESFRNAVQTAKANEPFQIEANWRTRSGTWRLIAWNVVRNGERVYAAGQDITDERTAAKALEHSAAELRLISESLPALVLYIDKEGRYQHVDETYAAWFGVRASEMAGRRVEDVLTAQVGRDYWEQVRPALERAFNGEAACTEAYRGYSGGQRYVELHCKPDLDATGRVRGVTVLVLDITQRKQTETELVLRAELLDNALEPVFAWHLGGEIIYWNPTAEALYGFSRKEALGRRSHDLLKTVLPWPAAEFECRLADAGSWQGELVHTTKDGRQIIVESRHRVITVSGRSVVVESNRDITARRAAEAEVRASESLFRSVAETAPVGIFRAASGGIVTWVNRRALQIWQMNEGEFLGRGWLARVHPDDIRAIEAAIRGSDSALSSSRMRYRVLLPSGETRRVEAVIAPVSRSDHNLGIVGVIEDVTDLIRREEQLQESEEKYRYTVDLSGQIVWTSDPKGSIQYFSRLGYELTGLAPAQALGAGWFHLVHAADREGTKAAWRQAVASGSPFDVEHRIRVRDGSYRWMRSRAFARRDASGSIVCWYGTTEDIDARKRSELMLGELNRELENRVELRTRELAEINKELETFSYSVSHDLRAPLRAIDGFGRMLIEDEVSRLSPSGIRLIERIRANTQRMAELIDDLLELSRVSRHSMDCRQVDLSSMAAGIIQELQRGDPDRPVKVTIEPGMAARADPRLLRIVLENLLGNAWKYTGKKPDGSIEFARVQIAGEWAWVVKDNGAGFDSAYAHQLFTPFHRLHLESEFPGSGIGLATVARIVRRHGGRVWAEGETDKGAAFYFTLGE